MFQSRSEGPILHLTLARPDVRNALDDALIAALTAAVEEAPATTRAIVLSGEGASFCAGGDLAWMRKAAGYTYEQNVADATRLGQLFEAFLQSPAVVIARVHGHAFGGGCGLVAAADVAICAEDTLFSFSEVRLGLVPATISPLVLQKIGSGHARALFTTGEAFSSQRALRIGLVHEAVPSDQLDGEVERRLAAVLAAGPEAVRESKALTLQPPLGLRESAELLARARGGEEGREGVAAFLEKRKPSFFVQR